MSAQEPHLFAHSRSYFPPSVQSRNLLFPHLATSQRTNDAHCAYGGRTTFRVGRGCAERKEEDDERDCTGGVGTFLCGLRLASFLFWDGVRGEVAAEDGGFCGAVGVIWRYLACIVYLADLAPVPVRVLLRRKMSLKQPKEAFRSPLPSQPLLHPKSPLPANKRRISEKQVPRVADRTFRATRDRLGRKLDRALL